MKGEQGAGGQQLVAWHGPDPQRVDVAYLSLGEDRLSGHGSSVCADYSLAYRLQTGPRWVTRLLDVRVWGDGWWRTLQLRRSANGTWSACRDGSSSNQGVELPALANSVDCDLGLCPVTNTMPVLREGLIEASHRAERRRIEMTMAWVSVPELTVVASPQVYETGPPVVGGGAQVRYSSPGFEAYIEVDEDGLVVNYPGLARRLYD